MARASKPAKSADRQQAASGAGSTPAPRAGSLGGAAQHPPGQIKIKQIGSLIGCTDDQRETVRGLGLRRMHQVVERQDTPMVRGMIRKVPHLVAVVE